MGALEVDPRLVKMLRTLAAHDVQYVLAGELAAAIHADGGFVSRLTLVPAAFARNAERLSAALVAIGVDADLGPAPAPDRLEHRPPDLRELSPCTFAAPEADVEIDFEPAGSAGYRDLYDDALAVELAPGVRPLVASPADLERIRRAAAGPAARAAAPAAGAAPPVSRAEPPAALPPEPAEHVVAARLGAPDATRT